MNISEREANASGPTILARLKRDLKTVERLVEQGDYESTRRAWAVSGRLSARIEILRDRTGGQDRLAYLELLGA